MFEELISMELLYCTFSDTFFFLVSSMFFPISKLWKKTKEVTILPLEEYY